MPLCPVVARAALSEYKVVGPEDLSKWTGPDRVHGSRLKIHENGAWNIFASCITAITIIIIINYTEK